MKLLDWLLREAKVPIVILVLTAWIIWGGGWDMLTEIGISGDHIFFTLCSLWSINFLDMLLWHVRNKGIVEYVLGHLLRKDRGS